MFVSRLKFYLGLFLKFKLISKVALDVILMVETERSKFVVNIVPTDGVAPWGARQDDD